MKTHCMHSELGLPCPRKQTKTNERPIPEAPEECVLGAASIRRRICRRSGPASAQDQEGTR
eukprot:5318736-Alexandrium_andersonii.AAC.1